MNSLFQDLRHSLRALRKTPVFTAAATLTMALGLGVNISVFTVMNAALLESLPVRDPDRLIHIYSWSEQGGDHFDFSYPLYVDFRDNARTLAGLAAYVSVPVGISTAGRSDRVVAEFVTANYFSLLGVEPTAGPGLAARDELRGSPATAVISERLWRTLFDNDPAVVGRSVLVNGKGVTIVGVSPRSFEGIVRGQRADLWMAVPQFAAIRNRPDMQGTRETSWLSLVGRLAPGVSSAQAAAELTAIGSGLNVVNAGPGFIARARAARAGDIGLVEGLGRPLNLLMLVVGLILVVASANVANLLLARSHARQSEIAMRQALGASRPRIVQQMLTEGAVLAFAGGAAGLLLAYWLVALFEVRTAAGTLLTLPMEPNGAVILFAIALSAIAALGAGLLPALTTSRPDLLMVIKGSTDGSRSRLGRHHVRSALVIVQVALSLVLVVAAGLFLRSLSRLQSIDPSLADSRVLAATLNLALLGYDEPRGRQFYSDILRRTRAVPGVDSASLSYVLPVTAGGMRMDVRGDSTKPAAAAPMVAVDLIPVSSGFFETVQVPVLAGRDFEEGDTATSPKVAVINETMKQRFWPDGPAVGQPFTIADETYQIVGVARDTKYRNLREAPKMVMYLPYAQSHQASANLLVRSSLPPDRVIESLRAAVREIDGGMPLYNVRTMAEHVSRSLYLDRLRAELIGYLAALALVLAAIGIYGVVSFTVAERTREVGIRLALGANPRSVLGMVLGSGARLALAGLAAGLLLSTWITRTIASDLFGVTTTDPVTLAASCAVLLGVALLAAFVPARRATRIDPMFALRGE